MLAAPASAEPAAPPLNVGVSYVSDTFANLRGGLKRGVRAMGKLDVIAEIDGGAFGLEGAQAYGNLQLLHGQSLSDELVGDGQVISNIDAVPGVRALEAWLLVPVAGKGSVKAGLVDLNGDFDVQNVGALFINASHGIGADFSQSGLNGPSIFPTTSSAVVLGWNDDGWSARLGIFDAVSGDPERPRRTVIRFPGEKGLLMVAEGEFALPAGTRLKLGGWTYSSRFDALNQPDPDGPQRRLSGNRGAYASVETVLAGEEEAKALRGWIRAGAANARINPIAFYVGGGVSFGDERSRVGMAIGHARLGDPAIASAELRSNRAETNFEMTWARKLSEQLSIQPDVQYVRNPGWDPARRDAVVAGVRVELTLF